ncbi:MAG: response regulator [Rhodospirillales bacterium]|nr:response regulator [Rhodospirillales bacterium]MCB9964585.1 response regulator [Rhodospirillales bacterium]MCB9973892.1 response regulator [Rhodospirillales bacterium]MCB9980517.1 response regulator [Rhodospirillales bacterium]
MKILIIDRDELNSQMLSSKIEALGHQVKIESVKNNALSHISRESADLVFLDPSPLTDPRPQILSIRRALGNYVYIALIDSEHEESLKRPGGANVRITKPYDPEKVKQILTNAARINSFIRTLGDDSIDFPSAGGIIAKSAFNQLFLSAIDRADRYGEHNYAVFIDVSNYADMLEKDGPYYADYAVAKMSSLLSTIRRQSDIIGQTAKHEYALLLQRPQYETEPVDAANRFAEELSKLKTVRETVESDPQISVKLIELPSGNKIMSHQITLHA